MLNELKGKGLFVFSDPGGAKPVLALVELIKSSLSGYRVISDRDYAFFENFSVVVNKPDGLPLDLLKQFKPDFVFTGTSYTSKIELEFISAANALSIKTYTFIDHWTFMRERFNNNGKEVFPEIILVVDEEAKQIAIDTGLDESKLVIFRNPYHRYLHNWQPKMGKEDLLASIGLSGTQKKIILYAPDPLSNLDGISVFGFDEITATKELNELIESTFADFQFIVNPHPNQNIESLNTVLNNKAILVPAGTDVNTLIFYADIVLGFFSNFLVEASLMNKKIIRYLCRGIENDPLAGKKIGEIAYRGTIRSKLYS